MQATAIWKDVISQSIKKAMEQYTYRTKEAPTNKTSNNSLDPLICAQLRQDGFEVDQKDQRCLLKSGVAVWRSRLTKEIVPTKTRRAIDIVVYRDGQLAGMVEVEDSLGHLARNWEANTKESRYDVLSIDRAPAGDFYYSYNSLERMASACRENAVEVPIFLAVGSIRKTDRIDDEMLIGPRLQALKAELIYKQAKE